jgi:hypothetical protein
VSVQTDQPFFTFFKSDLCRLLAIKNKPAQLIPKPLVVKHKFTNLSGKLCTLPLALQAASLITPFFRRCCTSCPDCVVSCPNREKMMKHDAVISVSQRKATVPR